MAKKKKQSKSQVMVRHALYAARNGQCSTAARAFDRALLITNGGLSAQQRKEAAVVIAGNCKRKAPKIARKLALYAR